MLSLQINKFIYLFVKAHVSDWIHWIGFGLKCVLNPFNVELNVWVCAVNKRSNDFLMQKP